VVDGPGLEATVPQGRATTVRLSGSGGLDVDTDPVGADTLGDPWLLSNARLDLRLGFRLGIFEGIELAEATPTPKPTATLTIARRQLCRRQPTVAPTRRADGRRPGTPAPTQGAETDPSRRPSPDAGAGDRRCPVGRCSGGVVLTGRPEKC
jgi:hypothetical protein